MKRVNIALIILAALFTASCTDFDNNLSEAEIRYNQNFIDQFGNIDPNQDWNMAQQVTAKINLPNLLGEGVATFYTSNPVGANSRLLGKCSIKDGRGVSVFDAVKGQPIYVTVQNLGKMVLSQAYEVKDGIVTIGESPTVWTRAFSDPNACPTTIKDIKSGLFTGILSDVKKYYYGGIYYTLAQLRTEATSKYEKGEVTVDNYLTTTPFTNSCFIDGNYDFSSATLKNTVTGPTSEVSYIYDGGYYASISALRTWAAGLQGVNTGNYGSLTPFNSDCVKAAGYDFSNAQLNTSKASVIDHDQYTFWDNRSDNKGQKSFSTIVELIEWSKTWETFLSQNNFYSDVFESTSLSWDGTNNCIDYSNATINGNVKFLKAGDYQYNNQSYTWQGLIDLYNNLSYNWADGPLTNIWFDSRLDFSSATVNTSAANLTVVPAGSYIYNDQVFANETALQNYTTENKLGNNGPYDNCCSASRLDFSSAVVDLEKAPLQNVPFDIDLTYLDHVETSSAAPWSRGWGYNLYGPKAFFEEQQYYYGKDGKTEDKYNTLYGSTEEEKRAMLDKVEAGFQIKSKGGVIELPFIYGATQIVDQFGYVFFKDGEDPLQQPHYILMEDGRPDVNLYLNSWKNGAEEGWTGTGMSTWITGLTPFISSKDNSISCYCHNPGVGKWSVAYGAGELAPHNERCAAFSDPSAACTMNCNPEGTGIYSSAMQHLSTCHNPMKEYLEQYNQQCYGTKYRLVYFDEYGKATYDIPEGLNIVFFICPVATKADLTSRTGYNVNDFMYSMPELNKRIKHYYYNTASPSYEEGNSDEGSDKLRGAVKACSWKQDGMTFLGFEDGGRDEDLNDIVFWVEGEYDPVVPQEDEIIELFPIKWHMNLYGVHDTNDGDLFSYASKKAGDPYTQPSTNPYREGYRFLGWSVSPTGSVIDGSNQPGTANQISGVMPNRGLCYFAMWEKENPNIPDIEYESWIIACEDLGTTDDFDFNDVVFEVKKAIGGTKLIITPLAAGGILPVEVTFNGQVLNGPAGRTTHFHSWFGDSGVSDGTIINTKGNESSEVKAPTVDGVVGRSFEIDVPSNFTLSSTVSEGRMGGFALNVYGGADKQNYEVITAPQAGKIPQMMLLPGDWVWVKERASIDYGYPLFGEWGSNYNLKKWFKYYIEEYLVKKPIYDSIEAGQVD